MKINKGTIKNINRKLIAGLLVVSLTAGLTGCAIQNQGLEYSENIQGRYVCNTRAGYGYLKDCKVVVFELNDVHTIYIVRKLDRTPLNSTAIRYHYYNIFGNQLLYDTFSESSSLKIIEETNLTDYLIIYNKVQIEYTEQELKDILEQIKTDYEEQKDKQLVIGN